MRSLIVLAALGAVAGLMLGCTTPGKVFTDYDREQSFAGYRSFAWISENPMSVSGDKGPNPVAARRLQDAIFATLKGKGYRFAEAREDADFVVAFSVGAREKTEVRTREVSDFYGPHWRWGYEYFGTIRPTRTEVDVRQYSEGVLSIDIFDVARRSPVWHASASKRLTRRELDGDTADSISAAVEAVLAEFPPR